MALYLPIRGKESESERDGQFRPSKNQVMVLGLGGKHLGSFCPSSSHAEYEGLIFWVT